MNILHVKSINHDSVWKVVKEVRIHYLHKNAYSLCDPISTLLNERDVQANTMKVFEKLGLNITDDLFENVPEPTLQTAGDMFIYLNSCPSPLLSLYTDLFKNASSRDIILTLRGILKTSTKGENKIALKIWTKIMDEMELNFKWIEKVTKDFNPDSYADNYGDDKFGNISNILLINSLLLYH